MVLEYEIYAKLCYYAWYYGGANVEITDLVGSANIYTFGKNSNTIIDLYKTSGIKLLSTNIIQLLKML